MPRTTSAVTPAAAHSHQIATMMRAILRLTARVRALERLLGGPDLSAVPSSDFAASASSRQSASSPDKVPATPPGTPSSEWDMMLEADAVPKNEEKA